MTNHNKATKVKKPFYKKWWVWVIAIILIAAIANPSEESATKETKQPASESTAPKAESKPKQEVKAEEPKQETKEEPKNDPNISKDEFDQIQNGMTYEEVVAIIGGEGEVMSEVGEKGTPYYSIMYKYDGEKGFGSNANFTFQANKLQAKAQFGLK